MLLLIILFQVSKRWEVKISVPQIAETSVYLNIEDVPITKQGVRRPVPPRPVVPLPVENPAVPEDLTIEENDLDFSNIPEDLPQGGGFSPIIPPRPIADVFPEYPESEKKKGVQGEIELSLLVDESGNVDKVVVVRNTTRSQPCEKAAIEAAYKMRFIPAKQNGVMVTVWMRKTYKFDLN